MAFDGAIKRFLKKRAQSLGFDVRRMAPGTEGVMRPIDYVLAGALAVKGTLNIVQVGANDARIGDPIYRFVSSHQQSTRIILVEPQGELHPLIEENYRGHPAKYVSGVAVSSSPGEYKLYRVKPSRWDEIQASYYSHAESYRASSGVTSANRDHVLKFVSKFADNSADVEDFIEELIVRSRTLRELVTEAGIFTSVDFLQVDAEGYDDDVIYASWHPEIRPSIISFEHSNLSQIAKERLSKFLRDHDYDLLRPPGANWIATRER